MTRIALVDDHQTPQPAPLDADFEHLRTPVAQWLAQVQAIVPSDNAFYTLVPGIDAHTIRHYTKLDEDTQVPPELLNFYKLVNVKQNAVTSAFFFEVAGVHFDLLAFKRIGEAWQDLETCALASSMRSRRKAMTSACKPTTTSAPAGFRSRTTTKATTCCTTPSPATAGATVRSLR